MIMILKEMFPYMFFTKSWSWSCRKGFYIGASFHHDNDLDGKVSKYVHFHDLIKNIYGNLSFRIMIMIQWRTYIETFPTGSWSWFNEEQIWKLFLQVHDHDLIKVSIYSLQIMIMILKEMFPYMFFIKSWKWFWRNSFHIRSWSLSIKIIIMIQWRTYMETFPSSPWSWFNEKRLWKLFFQDHDHDSMKNILCLHICSSLNNVHDLEGKVSIYILH
jgi:hypothetical protein